MVHKVYSSLPLYGDTVRNMVCSICNPVLIFFVVVVVAAAAAVVVVVVVVVLVLVLLLVVVVVCMGFRLLGTLLRVQSSGCFGALLGSCHVLVCLFELRRSRYLSIAHNLQKAAPNDVPLAFQVLFGVRAFFVFSASRFQSFGTHRLLATSCGAMSC